MSVEILFYNALHSYAPLTNIVGAQIWPAKIREKASPPCVTYIVASGAALSYTQDGPTDMRDPVFQVDCWGRTFDEARAVAKEVVAMCSVKESPLAGLYLFVEDDGASMFEEDTRFHRAMVMVRVWNRP